MKRILILTALNKEYKVVRNFLNNLEEEELDDGTIVEKGNPIDSNNSVVYIRECGKGNTKAALSTDKLIKHVKPELTMFIGIAGGIKDLNIGDVLVGEKVYGYEGGKDGKEFKARPELGKSSYRILERAKMESNKDDWKVILNGSNPKDAKVLVGNIVAGEKVLISENNELYQRIKSHYNDAHAIEMEGIGFMEGVYQNNIGENIVIRGISDLLENKNVPSEDVDQEKACSHAAAFGFSLIKKLEESPNRPIVEPSVKYKLIIDSQIPIENHKKLHELLDQLDEIASPNNHSITLNKITVGSTVLHLESNEETFNKLKSLSDSGKLSEILGYPSRIEKSDDDQDENALSIKLSKRESWSNIFGEFLEHWKNSIKKMSIEISGLEERMYSELSPIVLHGHSHKNIPIYFGAMVDGVVKPVHPLDVEVITSDELGLRTSRYITVLGEGVTPHHPRGPVLYQPTRAYMPGRIVHGPNPKRAMAVGPIIAISGLASASGKAATKMGYSNFDEKYEGYIAKMSDVHNSWVSINDNLIEPTSSKKSIHKHGYLCAFISNNRPDEYNNIVSVRINKFSVEKGQSITSGDDSIG